MLDRVENRQAKRDRDKIDRFGGVIRRIQSSGHVLANVRIVENRARQCKNSVCSRNSPQPCLDPPNQNGTMAKGR